MTSSAGPPSRTARRRQRQHRQRRTGGLVAGALAACALTVATVVVLVGGDGSGSPGRTTTPPGAAPAARPGDASFTDPPAAAAILRAAREAVQVVDSYDYRTLAADRAAGQARVTGEFATSYDSSMSGAVRTHALRSHTVQTCTVQQVGIASADAARETAVVLAFATLTVTDSDHPRAQRSAVTLNVRLQRVDGAWLIAAMADVSQLVSSAAHPPGNAALLAAVAAGRRAMTNLINYRRSAFAPDFQRALAGLGPAAADQQRAGQSAVRAAMDSGGYDLVGDVVEIAVEDAGAGTASLLVTGQRYQQADDGTRTPLPDVRAEVVMSYFGGQWLLTRLTSVSDG